MRGRPYYDLEAELDVARRTVRVRQRLEYPNRSGDALPDLVPAVAPNRRPGVFTLDELAMDGAPLAPGCCLDGAALRLPLPQPLPPGGQAVVTLSYTLRLPPLPAQAIGAGGALGWTLRQINLGEWLPLAAVRKDGQWYVPPAGAVGEDALHDAADFDLAVTLTGLPPLAEPQIIAPGTRTVGGGVHRFHLERSRTIAWVVSSQMAVATAPAGDVPVESYFFPAHERAGQAALRVAAAALQQFSQLFGPYPYPSLAVVEGDFLDGMEYCGLVFVGRDYYGAYDGSAANYLTAITAHEVAHQWWHCRVGNDPVAEPWLDEALATFAELLFYEAHFPQALPWWWNVRVQRFQPRGWVNRAASEFSTLRAYIDAVYLRGALMLHELRAQMGAPALQAAFLDYATRYDGQIATGDALWAILERHSSAPLDHVRARYWRPAP